LRVGVLFTNHQFQTLILKIEKKRFKFFFFKKKIKAGINFSNPFLSFNLIIYFVIQFKFYLKKQTKYNKKKRK
jgi:hypothetical protein